MAKIQVRAKCLTCEKVRVFDYIAFLRVESGDYMTDAPACPFCKATVVEVVQA